MPLKPLSKPPRIAPGLRMKDAAQTNTAQNPFGLQALTDPSFFGPSWLSISNSTPVIKRHMPAP